MQPETLETKIVIVGCGPVGMFGTLLLEHYGIDFIAVEKHPSVRTHPSAHWINASTKALFRQIPDLVEQLECLQQPEEWDQYRYFRYVETLFGQELGVADHFLPSVEEKLTESEFLFGQKPSHIPQNKLLNLMHNLVENKQHILFNQQISKIEAKYCEDHKGNVFSLINQKGEQIVKASYVILCNGSSSSLRENLPASISPIECQGEKNMMNFINIHFTSRHLAGKIKEYKRSAMLHFIYNTKIVGILVNHSGDQGQFVLQVVNFEPIVDLLQVYEPKQIIAMIFDEESTFTWQLINDLSIIGVGKWELSATLTNLLYADGVFLAGDAAHSFPPAGGFGMNTGLHDIHELVHSLLLAEKNPLADKQKIFNRYSFRRWNVDLMYLKKALQNYQIVKQIAKSLGLSSSPVEIFSKNSILKSVISKISDKKPHFLEKIRLKALKTMYKQKQLGRPALELFFDSFDIYAQNASILRIKIMKNNSFVRQRHVPQENRHSQANEKEDRNEQNRFYCMYARQWAITLQEIRAHFGEIDPSCIKFHSSHHGQYKLAQRLVSSDGTVFIR